MDNLNNQALLLKAIKFAAEKHRYQKRKDKGKTPYINHPINVANMLAVEGEEKDINLLIAALLHDTLEDTKTKPEEIEKEFGPEVLSIIKEVTDNKKYPSPVRKKLQVKNAHKISESAKKIKIADKICNIRDIITIPPQYWTRRRKIEYVEWTEQLVNEVRGVNRNLENLYDNLVKSIKEQLNKKK